MLSGELLKARTEYSHLFAGHIGGDDFFMGIANISLQKAIRHIEEIARQFASDVESFYDPEAIRRGHIIANDRNAAPQAFPLLTVSAAVVFLPADTDE